MTFSITKRAADDLGNIWRYSEENWGKEQADKYITHIYHQFEHISKQPFIGRHRPEISDGYYSLNYKSHIIFYSNSV